MLNNDMPKDVVILTNTKTQKEEKFHIDFGFFDDPSELRITIGGEEFKLVTTKSPEQIRLEKNMTLFGTIEFPKLAKKYPNFGSSSTNTALPIECENDIRNLLEKPKYKTTRQAMHKDENIFRKLLYAFVQFVSITRASDALAKEAEAKRRHPVYLFDYAMRYLEIMNRLVDKDHPPTKAEISKLFTDLNHDIEIDNRRPIGSNNVIQLLNPYTFELREHANEFRQLEPEDKYYDNSKLNETCWEALYKASCTTKTNIEDFLNHCQEKAEKSLQLTSDKLKDFTGRVIELHQDILNKFKTCLEANASCRERNDADQINQNNATFARHMKEYIEKISDWGVDFACDRRPLHEFFVRMLELQYDTVFYHFERHYENATTWIPGLMQDIQSHLPYLQKAYDGKMDPTDPSK